jgi:hypothetical protein
MTPATPLAPARKTESRFNAMRHGLTSQVACMTWEDREAFNNFCTALVADHHAEGPSETQLAQSIAEDQWRLNRARAIEHNIFALGFAASTQAVDSDNPQIDAALAQAQTFRDEAKTFGLITLYEQRIHRNLHRNLDRLRQMQTERRAARAQALAEHIEVSEINRLAGKPEPTDPTASPSRFVFSTDEIALAQFRRRRSNLLTNTSNQSQNRRSHPFREAA